LEPESASHSLILPRVLFVLAASVANSIDPSGRSRVLGPYLLCLLVRTILFLPTEIVEMRIEDQGGLEVRVSTSQRL
jgi:hypothetical protein